MMDKVFLLNRSFCDIYPYKKYMLPNTNFAITPPQIFKIQSWLTVLKTWQLPQCEGIPTLFLKYLFHLLDGLLCIRTLQIAIASLIPCMHTETCILIMPSLFKTITAFSQLILLSCIGFSGADIVKIGLYLKSHDKQMTLAKRVVYNYKVQIYIHYGDWIYSRRIKKDTYMYTWIKQFTTEQIRKCSYSIGHRQSGGIACWKIFGPFHVFTSALGLFEINLANVNGIILNKVP